ncbi:helicase-related protein [Rhodopirellula sp. MGV]|uniref:preprotein translocase subunit SecA n=1 Tax=Rhodopirellula sp. MGV TaxID=2023130 RepID=UPI000B968F62|nr:helicase-related protein [Rhodopirellula sp. MGV]OYP35925.1 hypothetical protein CGZ80_09135 [Rhodopirellula sp. MGV]PNY34897.1 hypothetical protein C2E31_21135 [Rhodopirellula baltica]
MLLSQARIANYRTVVGQPKRGACKVSAATQRQIDKIRKRCGELQSLSSDGFSEACSTLRQRLSGLPECTLAANVVESFALTNEALRRVTGMTYYDVQLAAGFALAAGTVAEIQTGEGKTITTALPAVLYGWTGKGVHVATTNDYLSGRDFETLRPVFEQLGLSAGLLVPQSPHEQKSAAYACAITYGPGYEFGFDFLRDRLLLRSRKQQRLGTEMLRVLQGLADTDLRPMQRGHFVAIIDEADSVLIDEASTPLVLSGGKSTVSTSPVIYQFALAVAQELSPNVDYQVDRSQRRLGLTEQGIAKVHLAFEHRPAGMLSRPLADLVENALRAQFLFERDVDYVVQGQQVLLVDSNTGRIHDERKWSNGLHQAVEAKERVAITDENETQARITRQRYMRLYERVAGLSGTVTGSEDELREFYRLPVVKIGTHRECRRVHHAMRFFADFESKAIAIATAVSGCLAKGQPVLIGTQTIDESQRLSQRLTQAGIAHQVLNGLQDQHEADVIAKAGQCGAVTVATNMAGRGTDIKPDERAIAAGGLHVIATTISTSSRVDRQLIGRAARQGDPGSCQFYIAADDDLIVAQAPELSKQMRGATSKMGECETDFTTAIRKLQQHCERAAVLHREQLLAHDRWHESIQTSL